MMAVGWAAARPASAETTSSTAAATRRIASRSHIRNSVATRSLRDLPARSRPPRSAPHRSIRPRSSAPCILVGDDRKEAAIRDVFPKAVEARQQSVALVVGEQSGAMENLRVAFEAATSYGANTQSK